MGTPIVKNLLKAGYAVRVYNRTAGKDAEVVDAGARVAESMEQLMTQCDVVFTMVSDDAAVKEVFEGKGGLLTHGHSGKLIIDMSTVSPDTSRYLSALCEGKDIRFLEAPVSGSVKPAQDGTLIVLAAGPRDAYETAKPLFDVIGKLSLHLGDAGAGSYAKLAMNYYVALTLQGVAEAVLFAEANGVKPDDMLTIMNEGAFASAAVKGKTPSILSQAFPPAFALKLMAKDLRLMKGAHLKSPMFAPVHDSYQEAVKAGLGEEDVMAILKFLRTKKHYAIR